jgi:hypothetical protein
MRESTSLNCPNCKRSFSVLEDEQFDHNCPHCGFGEEKVNYCGIDAMGTDIIEGDYIIEFDGEIILESNIIDYLVDVLGAKQKVAGEEE